MTRTLRVLWTSCLLFGVVSGPADLRAQEPAAEAATGEVDLTKEMRERASRVTLTVEEAREQWIARPLNETPLFRYHDARRDILDAALWGYGRQGRPAALMKTEAYRIDSGEKWVFCLASLSDGIINAAWDDGATYRAKQPGLELKDIPNAPRPAASANLRLIQIKRLTERVAAQIQNAEDDREPMRLMPTPICRYDDKDGGLIDGAIFGYTMGTNPDVLLVIELHEQDGRQQWRCGAAGMTSAGFAVLLDGSEFLRQEWTLDVSGRPNAYDRWMWRRVIEP